MRSIIQRIATGPELSKDISREEARFATSMLLSGEADPIQGAVFLIALRMKRETDEENRGVLDAIRDATDRAVAEVDDLVDIADPYDGYNRTLPPSPFLPAVMAALDVPAVSHGMETVSPKYGATHRKILRAAGVPVTLSSAEAAERIADPTVGWAYVDQEQFCPQLNALIDFRTTLVKRPAITTVEVMGGPVVGRKRTHLVTGYVHKPYPRIYALLARHAGYDSALLVRGVEGGVVPSLRQAGKLFRYENMGEEQGFDVDPADLGIEQDLRSVPFPDDLGEVPVADGCVVVKDMEAAAKAAAEAGLEALDGVPGGIRDGLVYAGASILWHRGLAADLRSAADAVRGVLDDGTAKARFMAARV
ncbi:MAG: anthranilate phosphoribosyltransferase [Gammaproteobacteria bacterium]